MLALCRPLEGHLDSDRVKNQPCQRVWHGFIPILLFLILSLAMPTPSDSAPQRWIVTLDGNESPTQVAKRLRAEGFVVEQVLDAVGVITGQASAETVAALRSLPGLQSIEPDQMIQLPNPGTGPTW